MSEQKQFKASDALEVRTLGDNWQLKHKGIGNIICTSGLKSECEQLLALWDTAQETKAQRDELLKNNEQFQSQLDASLQINSKLQEENAELLEAVDGLIDIVGCDAILYDKHKHEIANYIRIKAKAETI